MNEQHASALALIKELHAMGASHITVGDVSAKFDLVAWQLPKSAAGQESDLGSDEREELLELRGMRKSLLESGVI